jgi:hypothetical protein
LRLSEQATLLGRVMACLSDPELVCLEETVRSASATVACSVREDKPTDQGHWTSQFDSVRGHCCSQSNSQTLLVAGGNESLTVQRELWTSGDLKIIGHFEHLYRYHPSRNSDGTPNIFEREADWTFRKIRRPDHLSSFRLMWWCDWHYNINISCTATTLYLSMYI